MPTKKKPGRPAVLTPEALQLLKDAFMLGCTDEEACLRADISTSTLYNYQKANPSFLDKKQLWKQNPILLARETTVRGLKRDHNHALRFLERKKKDEFSLKQEIDHTTDGEPIQFINSVPRPEEKND